MLLATLPARALMSIATIGDSFADSIYLGIKSQPRLVQEHGINLNRWSRPNIGLTRIDYFDYAGWLRTNDQLRSADFCVVQVGANDLQRIPDANSEANRQWLSVGTPAWQDIYERRLEDMVTTLKTRRCAEVVWLLQPNFERNKYLGKYHAMMNAVQMLGLRSRSVAAFEIAAREEDYSRDGIHFNGPFSMKLGRAVVRVFESWKQSSTRACAACHTAANFSPNYAEIAGPELSPLVLREARLDHSK